MRAFICASSLFAWAVVSPAIAAATEQPIRLAADPALSPDGKTLAFAWAGDLWTVSSSGGIARPITRHSARDRQPSFSPDGKTIAFVSDRETGDQVFIMPAEGGAPTQITFHTVGQRFLGFFPDGRGLLTLATRDHSWFGAARLFQVSLAQPQAETLLFDDYGQDGRISPDGKRMLFTREGEAWWRKGYVGSQQSQIWLYDIEVKSFTKLVEREGGARWPLWKPDGKGFYFVAPHEGALNLWESNLDGTESRPLTSMRDDSVVFPAISADGSMIAFRHLFDLYSYEPGKGGPPRKLTISHAGDRERPAVDRRVLTSASAVAFTQDGLEIAFISGGDLWVMDTVLLEPKQITSTPEEERDPVFAGDGNLLMFASDQGGQCDLYQMTKGDAARFWWQQSAFKQKRLTNDPEVESNVKPSPDGSKIAYTRVRGEIWLANIDGSSPRKLVDSFDDAQFDWSPDGKWIAYAISDEDYNRDVWIVPADGSKPAVNISMHPNNDFGPIFSPDGKMLAFTGERGTENGLDVYFVYLRKSDDDRQSRDRKLENAIEKMKKPKPGEPSPKGAGQRAGQPPRGGPPPAADAVAAPDATKDSAAKPRVVVEIDFPKIHERVHRISIPNSSESGLLWSPDSKRLGFGATIGAKPGLFAVDIPDDLSPKPLTSSALESARWLETGNQIVGLASGSPASFVPGGREATFSFRATQTVDRAAKFRAAFDLAWRTMRDRWYDERLGNRDWDGIRRKYIDMAVSAPDVETFATVVQLMLGELNGSHLGFTPIAGGAGGPARRRGPAPPGAPAADPAESRTWSVATPHLGLRFDPAHVGSGLLVRQVIEGGPTDREASKVLPGELITTIDGESVNARTDLARLLNGPLDRDIELIVRDASDRQRTIRVRPVPYGALNDLLYEQWIKDTRSAVDKLSNGRLGYLHIRGMDFPSFTRFEQELFAIGYGKDGLIIDVRNNGGGSTADHLLTALTQPLHAITVGRGGKPGYPQDRKIYTSWHKPIVVLCNQNSFSNAEIFSHAIKTLGRGKLVGAPTAGGVISTGGTMIMDIGMLRLPNRGWHVVGTGDDMELNGAKPDVVVWPDPGDFASGKDRQLEKAIETLMADVDAWRARPQPKLTKATERAGDRPAEEREAAGR